MKKIMTSVLILVFLLGMGSLAYAGQNTDNAAKKNTVFAQKQEAVKQKIQGMGAFKAEYQEQIAEIRQNRTETMQLRAEAREAYKAAVQHIKDLKADPDQLTEEQIAALKEAKESLQQLKKQFANSKGGVAAEVKAMKAARKEKNPEEIKASLDKIIEIQHERMEIIQQGIDEMKGILEI